MTVDICPKFVRIVYIINSFLKLLISVWYYTKLILTHIKLCKIETDSFGVRIGTNTWLGTFRRIKQVFSTWKSCRLNNTGLEFGMVFQNKVQIWKLK